MSALITTRPALLIVWLIFLTLNTGLLVYLTATSWIMYAVVLLFTGGIIVLFTYIVTLVFSLKITFSNLLKRIIAVWISFLIVFVRVPYLDSQEIIISNLYLMSGTGRLALMGGYLLLVLLAVVKLTACQRGPIKSFFKNEL